ncbi:hypothetical protein [Vibrio cholerae]|nr:hypothetical protein [Vibrio cholerae]
MSSQFGDLKMRLKTRCSRGLGLNQVKRLFKWALMIALICLSAPCSTNQQHQKTKHIEVNMPKTVTVGRTWVLLSELLPGSSPTDKFEGQVQEGAIKLKASENTPTDLLDCYTFRSAGSGGAGDEFFEGGDGVLKVYAIAHNCTSSTLVIEVM